MHALRYLRPAILSFTLLGTHAAAASPGEASAAYGVHEEAHRCYQKGNFACALEKLKRAMRLAPASEAYLVLFDIAQVHNAMGDWVHAAKAYRQYLEDGGDRLTAAEREKVDKKLRDLAPLIATIVVVTDIEGAEVLLDKESIGTTPLDVPLEVNAGAHDVTIRARGYPDQTQSASFAGGARERLTFAFAPALAQASPSPPSSASLSAISTPHAPGAVATSTTPAPAPLGAERGIAWSATGVLALGATITGLLALSHNSALSDRLREYPTTGEAIESERTSANRLATVTNVLWAATAVAGGVSLWLTLDGRASGPQVARAGEASRLSVTIGPSEMRIGTRF